MKTLLAIAALLLSIAANAATIYVCNVGESCAMKAVPNAGDLVYVANTNVGSGGADFLVGSTLKVYGLQGPDELIGSCSNNATDLPGCARQFERRKFLADPVSGPPPPLPPPNTTLTMTVNKTRAYRGEDIVISWVSNLPASVTCTYVGTTGFNLEAFEWASTGSYSTTIQDRVFSFALQCANASAGVVIKEIPPGAPCYADVTKGELQTRETAKHELGWWACDTDAHGISLHSRVIVRDGTANPCEKSTPLGTFTASKETLKKIDLERFCEWGSPEAIAELQAWYAEPGVALTAAVSNPGATSAPVYVANPDHTAKALKDASGAAVRVDVGKPCFIHSRLVKINADLSRSATAYYALKDFPGWFATCKLSGPVSK